MASWQARLSSFALRHLLKPKLVGASTAIEARMAMERGAARYWLPASIGIARDERGGEWVTGPSARRDTPLLLFLHGGGYVACNPRTHRPYTCWFAQSGWRVFAPDYRLAPEHRFPAGLDDAVIAYQSMRHEYPEASIAIAGDSAGGGLAIATMLRLRDAGDPLPCAAALFSPLTDLTGSGASRVRNSKRCALFTAEVLDRVGAFYLPSPAQGIDTRNPLVSPLFAELQGLPPLLIHVGEDETLLDDSTLFAERARAAGIHVELETFPRVPHDWQLGYQVIPEGRASLVRADSFMKLRCRPSAAG